MQRCAGGHVGTLHYWEISAELTFLNKARVVACRVGGLSEKPNPSRQAWVSRLSPERGAAPSLRFGVAKPKSKTRAQKTPRARFLILRSARTRAVRETQSRVRASRTVRAAAACALMLREAS